MTVIWCMVPDIWCVTHNFLLFWTIFYPFTPPPPPPPHPITTRKIKILKKWKKLLRYYHFTKVYHKWQSYDVWFLIYWVQQTDFFVILDHFFPFYPPNKLKNQNFEKMKKMSGDTIILHRSTISDNYMMYGSWDMAKDRQNFASFWTVALLPF